MFSPASKSVSRCPRSTAHKVHVTATTPTIGKILRNACSAALLTHSAYKCCPRKSLAQTRDHRRVLADRERRYGPDHGHTEIARQLLSNTEHQVSARKPSQQPGQPAGLRGKKVLDRPGRNHPVVLTGLLLPRRRIYLWDASYQRIEHRRKRPYLGTQCPLPIKIIPRCTQ